MRSLIRLFIGAVLLCLAWLVLTSGQASATERPEPARPLGGLGKAVPLVDGSGLDSIVGGLLPKSSEPGERPERATAGSAAASTKAAKARHEKRSQKTSSTIRPSLAQPVEQAVGTVRSTVDTGLSLVEDVTDVTASVPVVGAPVVDITNAVDTLVRSLPVLGEPSPIVPLPIGDVIVPDRPIVPATPAAPVTDPVAGEADHRIPRAAEATPGGAAALAGTPAATTSRSAALAPVASSVGPGSPPLPTLPLSPRDALPAPPTQPSPGGASGAGAADQAAATEALSISIRTTSSRTGADWRLPCGPCEQPGTRPD
ncbi:hypothetical protein [Pedococcus dokdonensis]|uniref:hypothetical protein n=1 Tax=Pedococcus dokdonensis TaxID=443156 RepID=UPI000B8A2588|nr:hypothetical protein [Pedococcus dokdonensis]